MLAKKYNNFLKMRAFFILLAGLISCSMYSSAFAAEYQIRGNIIGQRATYQIKYDDSLFEIARMYDIGYNDICNANPGFDPFIPEENRFIVIPTEWILPDVEIRRGIVVNLAEMRLYYFLNDATNSVMTFPVGIGDEGKETPLGLFSVIEKIKNPAWYVPKSIQLEKPDLPAVVPPGPDNPMGSRALRLSKPTFLIHGTNRPWGIGTRNSHGCMRLYEEDVLQLFEKVDIGTRVTIVNQPIKIVVAGNEVYMEVHDYENGSDLNKEALKIIESKSLINDVDLDEVKKAVIERSGLPVDISKKRAEFLSK
ncbi:MAG: L,D-transpeptidase family protein [Proteobacteria bacterium]|nr:L,D-transpeptidase family protein [Pseudomonadota bacterium]